MALDKYYRVDFSKPKEDSKDNSDSQYLIMDDKRQIGSVIMRNFK